MSVAVISCQTENLEPQTPQEEAKTVEVIVSLGDQTKGFTDLEGITWEVGDQIKWGGSDEYTSEALTADDISSDGYTATFKFDAGLIAENRTGWFVSTKNHGGNTTEVEFTLGQDNGNSFTQDIAGEMNNRYLFLHSGIGETSISQEVAPENISMTIAGTIFRVIPYTSKYNNEYVKSVKMASNTKLVGTVAYDRTNGTYSSVTEVQNGGWKAYDNVHVTLGESFSLSEATSAENSKGIYIPVAATKEGYHLDGYKYIVETDQAMYTFDAMNKTLEVKEGVVKNVFLNLDNENAKRVGNDDVKGELKYVDRQTIAAMNTTPKEVSFMAGTYSLTYCFAVTRDSDASWPEDAALDASAVQNRDAGVIYYNQVKISVIDDATNQPATWCSVAYRDGDTWLDCTVSDNTVTEPRTATVTLTFDDVNGYILVDEWKTPKTFKITQMAYSDTKDVTIGDTGVGDKEIPSAAHDFNDAGTLNWHVLKVNGIAWANFDPALDYADEVQALYKACKFEVVDESGNSVDWLQVRYSRDDSNDERVNDTHWEYKVTANDTGAERKATIKFTIGLPTDKYTTSVPVKEVVVTQKAAE